MELRSNSCKIELNITIAMRPTITLPFVLLMFVACAAMFTSCQRNGGSKTTETPDVVEPLAVVDTPNEDVPETVEDSSIIYPETDTTPVPLQDSSTITNYSWVLMGNDDGTFGYEVMRSGNLIVSQPNIPGEGSTAGFTSKEQAAAAAELVISKLEKDILPPTISAKELKKILKN